MACWAIMPWLLLASASLAQRYPFGVPRMMVFLAPPLVIAVAAGIVVISRQVSLLVTQQSGPGMVFGALLALLPVSYMVNVPLGNSYWIHHDFPAVLRVLERERRPGEIVFVDVDAAPCVRYYAPNSDESFYCVPMVAGTLLPQDYNYERRLRQIAARAGPRWWFLKTGEPSPRIATAGHVIQAYGYRLQLVVESGNDGPYGKAQLFLVTRHK